MNDGVRRTLTVLALDTVTGQLCKTVAQELAESAASLPTCVSLAKIGLVDYVFDPATGTLKKPLDPYEEYLKRRSPNNKSK